MTDPGDSASVTNRGEPLLLLAMLASPVLPAGWGLAALGLLLLGWLRVPNPRRQQRLVAALALIAGLCLLAGLVGQRRAAAPAWIETRVESQLAELWTDLETAASEAAAALVLPAAEGESLDRVAAFESLRSFGGDTAPGEVTLLLFDPDGEAVAWAGPGLRHQIDAGDASPDGLGFRQSYASVSLLASRGLPVGASSWRVVAGRSLPTNPLPIARPSVMRRWTLLEDGSTPAPGATVLEPRVGPRVAVAAAGSRSLSAPVARPAHRWALLALSAAVLALVLLRRREAGDASGGPWPLGWRLLLLLAAAAALMAAARLETGAASILLAGIVAAFLGWSWAGALAGLGTPWVRGLAVAVATGLVVLAAHAATHPADLASALRAAPSEIAVRMALFLVVLALMLVVAVREPVQPQRSRAAWIAASLLFVGALVHDRPLWGVLFLAAGSALAVVWLERRPARASLTSLGTTALLSASIAALGWETAHRESLGRKLERELLADMAPATGAELQGKVETLARAFLETELETLALRSPESLDPRDLAFTLWRQSPLAVHGALSALVVLADGEPVSSFSFGLPLTERGEIDWRPASWRRLNPPVWRGSLVEGEAVITSAGVAWGVARYWMLLRPGFRRAGAPIEEVSVGLLGDLSALRPSEGLLGPVRYGLFSEDGRVLVNPWPGGSVPVVRPADVRLQAVTTPTGRAAAAAAIGPDGIRVLYLPALSPPAALERVATHALGTLFPAVSLVLLGALVTVDRRTVSALARAALQSYSKRLLLVYSLLILLPILLLSGLVLREFERRLERQQLQSGRAALESAQRVLGEYVLALEPGFGIDATLDDELLVWLSRVVHHEVNLYWGSMVYATGKRELFTAGLLSGRIPGEIYSAVALGGAETASRVSSAGGTSYLQLYAPVKVPGVPLERFRLFLSLPLLAQQVETAGELSTLRRRTVLVATGLLLVLAALGGRLARGFTAPLMEIVDGTRRIAAGARSLELSPSELELATLVEAIDRMAGRIAEGRQDLLREKHLVERMIDNITSGVVSVDREGSILMLNSVAQNLLGAAVAESLPDALGRKPELAGVAAFLDRDGAQARLDTVVIPGAEVDDQEWTLVWVPLPGEGEPSALLVVEDVTEVLQGQRLQAWAEMARIIAHEIKNPLTPIRLSAEHMRQVHAADPTHFDEVFERCTSNILTQVGELQQIASEFSAYSRSSELEVETVELADAVRAVAEGYMVAPGVGKGVTFDSQAEGVRARVDVRLLARAVRNLIENALRVVSEESVVVVRVDADELRARIRVLDDGPGVEPELLHRIFEPYFSTHDTGTGLGLPIAKRIAEQHRGEIQARNRAGGGLEVTLSLPRE